MTNREHLPVARGLVVALLTTTTLTLGPAAANAGVSSTDPCSAQVAAAQEVDRQISSFNARAGALDQQIAAHNSQPHNFRLPQQAAQYNAYNARAAALEAQLATVRAEARRLNSTKAQTVRGLQACREQVRAQADARRRDRGEAGNRPSDGGGGDPGRFEAAVDCMKGGLGELAGWDGSGGSGDPGPLEAALDCMNGVAEVLGDGSDPGGRGGGGGDPGPVETAADCVQGGLEELAGDGPGDPPEGGSGDLGPLEIALDCMNGAGEVLGGGGSP
jgi:hypothetical protein